VIIQGIIDNIVNTGENRRLSIEKNPPIPDDHVSHDRPVMEALGEAASRETLEALEKTISHFGKAFEINPELREHFSCTGICKSHKARRGRVSGSGNLSL